MHVKPDFPHISREVKIDLHTLDAIALADLSFLQRVGASFGVGREALA
jgi:hypothetical protein